MACPPLLQEHGESGGETNYNQRMPTTASAAAVALTSGNLSDLQTDLLVVPVFDGESAATAVPGLDDATGGAVRRGQRRIPGPGLRAVPDTADRLGSARRR